MHVVSRKALKAFWELHPDARTSLQSWYKIVGRAAWTNFNGLRDVFPHADAVGTCVVFNIGGNKYRLIGRVRYAKDEFRGRVYVRFVLTHSDYDIGKWKEDCDCR